MNHFDTFQREAKAALRVALQWFFLAIPTGLVCGLVGTLFHLSVECVTELRAAQPWLLFLLPAAGLLITALYKITKCEGVGTNNVIRAVQSGEPVSILLVPAIFLGTVLTHLCGGSAGREGAALQMGGSIGWNLGTLLGLKDHVRRTESIRGMAAFFSALFGTPLSATLFGIMVEDVGLAFSVAFVPGFAAALIAYGVSLAYVSECVRAQTGRTYKELLQKHRMETAARLLRRSDLNIQQIIAQVGYENTSYFYRLFHERYGLSPREYRLVRTGTAPRRPTA